jgi:hypothetical protein
MDAKKHPGAEFVTSKSECEALIEKAKKRQQRWLDDDVNGRSFEIHNDHTRNTLRLERVPQD